MAVPGVIVDQGLRLGHFVARFPDQNMPSEHVVQLVLEMSDKSVGVEKTVGLCQIENCAQSPRDFFAVSHRKFVGGAYVPVALGADALKEEVDRLNKKIALQEEAIKAAGKVESDLARAREFAEELRKKVTDQAKKSVVRKREQGVIKDLLSKRFATKTVGSHTYDVYAITIDGETKKFVTESAFDTHAARCLVDINFANERHNAIASRFEAQVKARSDAEDRLEKMLELHKKYLETEFEEKK